ncbi:phage tail tube protein [Sphingomonas montanisoli]|uniref:Phage tail protein n=1 Tax=Sphingomonas montanisoli TaxID=2606412 RepID=A0A5D9C4T7_9SPHN|nr:phage tail tube protein [Sphingomonas montanisoli]TZG26506.1 phage tail protein [Sphingomonas montanisoli]
MSTAKLGFGSAFYMGATGVATEVTKIAEVTSVSPPNEQRADVEVTHYESPGQTREYIAGLIDPGEITVSINWVPGSPTDDLLVTAKNDGAVRQMKIKVPGAAATPEQFKFPGIVKGFERTVPIDGQMTANVTIRIAGAVTQAAYADADEADA